MQMQMQMVKKSCREEDDRIYRYEDDGESGQDSGRISVSVGDMLLRGRSTGAQTSADASFCEVEAPMEKRSRAGRASTSPQCGVFNIAA